MHTVLYFALTVEDVDVVDLGTRLCPVALLRAELGSVDTGFSVTLCTVALVGAMDEMAGLVSDSALPVLGTSRCFAAVTVLYVRPSFRCGSLENVAAVGDGLPIQIGTAEHIGLHFLSPFEYADASVLGSLSFAVV